MNVNWNVPLAPNEKLVTRDQLRGTGAPFNGYEPMVGDVIEVPAEKDLVLSVQETKRGNVNMMNLSINGRVKRMPIAIFRKKPYGEDGELFVRENPLNGELYDCEEPERLDQIVGKTLKVTKIEMRDTLVRTTDSIVLNDDGSYKLKKAKYAVFEYA